MIQYSALAGSGTVPNRALTVQSQPVARVAVVGTSRVSWVSEVTHVAFQCEPLGESRRTDTSDPPVPRTL